MNKRKYYLIRTLKITSLLIVCSVIAYQLIMLRSTANQIKQQQSERFSYSLTNLASAEATRFIANKKTKELQRIIKQVSDDPLVKNATIYDKQGKVLYQSGDIQKRSASQTEQEVVPYITELYKEKTKLGYIHISLEQGKIFQLVNDYRERSGFTMLLLVVISFSTGVILTFLFANKILFFYSIIAKAVTRFKN